MDYRVISHVPNNAKLQGSIKGDIWPEFMFHDPIAQANWMKFFEFYPEYQLTLMKGEEVIGIANSLPCVWHGPFDELPEEGWDWAIQQGMAYVGKTAEHNLLLVLQISLNVRYAGQGISYRMLAELLNLAKAKGLRHVAIPVRPNTKTKYPLTPIDSFVRWTREDGLPFDPWLRVHVRSGGKIVKTCKRSTYIPGTVAEWEEWTGMKFPETGEYIVEGALVPVKIDREKDLGEYLEPNVWIVYEVN